MAARRTKKSDQEKLDAPGMDGPNPKLTRACDGLLDIYDEIEEATDRAEKQKDEIKKLMQDEGIDKLKVRGRPFRIKTTQQLVVGSKRAAGKED